MYNRDVNNRVSETRPVTHTSINVAGERSSLSNAGFNERMNPRRVSDLIRRSKSVDARCNRTEHVSRPV
jgi:hypothetical protein